MIANALRTFVLVTLAAATVSGHAQSQAAASKQSSGQQEKWWEQVEPQSVSELSEYLDRHPDSPSAGELRLRIDLFTRIADINAGKRTAKTVIPFKHLGTSWEDYQKFWEKWNKQGREGGEGMMVYWAEGGDSGSEGMRARKRHPFVVTATGLCMPPTKNGSVLGFRTVGAAKLNWDGLKFVSDDGQTLWFAVFDGKGLVHLKGNGTCTLGDGTEISLRDESPTEKK